MIFSTHLISYSLSSVFPPQLIVCVEQTGSLGVICKKWRNYDKLLLIYTQQTIVSVKKG